MITVGVAGGGGYTGREAVRLLLRHPDADVVVVASNTFKGKTVDEVFPDIASSTPLLFEPNDPKTFIGRADVVFLCLPHGKSMRFAEPLLEAGIVVIDLSADFRFENADIYEKWYSTDHTAKKHLASAVYGLPELHREQIATANLVAAPGCYPTSAILALAPVIGRQWVDKNSVVINSVSGLTGAGRKANSSYLLAEMEGNFYAYGAPSHRHTPEIEQELSRLAGEPVTVTFIPHLLPTARGIYTTVTLKTTQTINQDAALEIYRLFYDNSRFVKVTEGFPQMKWTVGSNRIQISVNVDERSNTLIITSTLDNLVKGASGQAVQCFNIRYGLDEGAGLE